MEAALVILCPLLVLELSHAMSLMLTNFPMLWLSGLALTVATILAQGPKVVRRFREQHGSGERHRKLRQHLKKVTRRRKAFLNTAIQHYNQESPDLPQLYPIILQINEYLEQLIQEVKDVQSKMKSKGFFGSCLSVLGSVLKNSKFSKLERLLMALDDGISCMYIASYVLDLCKYPTLHLQTPIWKLRDQARDLESKLETRSTTVQKLRDSVHIEGQTGLIALVHLFTFSTGDESFGTGSSPSRKSRSSLKRTQGYHSQREPTYDSGMEIQVQMEAVIDHDNVFPERRYGVRAHTPPAQDSGYTTNGKHCRDCDGFVSPLPAMGSESPWLEENLKTSGHPEYPWQGHETPPWPVAGEALDSALNNVRTRHELKHGRLRASSNRGPDGTLQEHFRRRSTGTSRSRASTNILKLPSNAISPEVMDRETCPRTSLQDPLSSGTRVEIPQAPSPRRASQGIPIHMLQNHQPVTPHIPDSARRPHITTPAVDYQYTTRSLMATQINGVNTEPDSTLQGRRNSTMSSSQICGSSICRSQDPPHMLPTKPEPYARFLGNSNLQQSLCSSGHSSSSRQGIQQQKRARPANVITAKHSDGEASEHITSKPQYDGRQANIITQTRPPRVNSGRRRKVPHYSASDSGYETEASAYSDRRSRDASERSGSGAGQNNYRSRRYRQREEMPILRKGLSFSDRDSGYGSRSSSASGFRRNLLGQ